MSAVVSDLIIYPLKSAAAIHVQDCAVQRTGLENDRRWMIVKAEADADGSHSFITQRTFSGDSTNKLAIIQPRITDGNGLAIQLGGNEIIVPLRQPGDKTLPVTIWDTKGQPARDCGDEVAAVLSDYLGRNCRLVEVLPEQPRGISAQNRDLGFAAENDIVSFADGFPFLIISTASLQALNEALVAQGGQAVLMSRFRTNIVLEGLQPFEEETIDELVIGGTVFRPTKPCGRCVITTINQETGDKDKSSQPLAILGRQRHGDATGIKGAYFGVNAIAYPNSANAIISTGMEVTIKSRKPPHPVYAARETMVLRPPGL